MATHDYIIANQSGAAFRTDLNNALAAIVSNNSNSSEPATMYAYQWWADTSNAVMKIRNSSNNGWIELFQLDGTLTLEDGSASTPALAFRDDLDTGIYSSADNKFNVATAGTERMELAASGTVFNEDGADVDFRIEGDTQANLFHVDAGNDRIGIRTDSPESVLDVRGIDDQDNFKVEVADSIFAVHTDATTGEISLRAADGSSSNNAKFMTFHTEAASAERLRIDSSGRLLLGTTTEGETSADNFTIADTSSDCGISIRSGTSNAGNIFFSDGTSGNDEFRGYVQYNHGSNFMRFATDSVERVRIGSDGHVGIGTTGNVSSSTGMTCFRVLSDNRRQLMLGTTSTGERALIEFFNGNGGVGSINTNGSNTSYNTTSDYRLKENVTAISDGITRLKTLKPSRFNFKVDKDKTVDGFLAHEVTAVPEAISGTKDEVDPDNKPIYQGIDQSKLVPLLTAALQEAVAKIEVLETKVAALEAA